MVAAGYTISGKQVPTHRKGARPHALRLVGLSPILVDPSLNPSAPSGSGSGSGSGPVKRVKDTPSDVTDGLFFLPSSLDGFADADAPVLERLVDPRESSCGIVTAHNMVAAVGGGNAKKSARAKNLDKQRAHHDLGFLPLGCEGSRVLQVLVKPSGYIEAKPSSLKSDANEFLLTVLSRDSSKMKEMLTDNGGEFGGE